MASGKAATRKELVLWLWPDRRVVPWNQGAEQWPGRGLRGRRGQTLPSPRAGTAGQGPFQRTRVTAGVLESSGSRGKGRECGHVLLPAGCVPGEDPAPLSLFSVPRSADMKPLGPLVVRGFRLRSHNGNSLISQNISPTRAESSCLLPCPHPPPDRLTLRRQRGAGSLCGICRSSREVRHQPERPPPRRPESSLTRGPTVSAQGERGQVWSPPPTPTAGQRRAEDSGRAFP